jgi:SAM-dependent methyltransferase
VNVSAAGPEAGRFHETRRAEIRNVPRWHRLAYIVRALPAELEMLTADVQPPASGRVLDFGCADMPYRRFFQSEVDYVGADLPGNPDAAVEILPDGRLPVADGSFDTVLSTQVLEHVTDPALYLRECARALHSEGRMLLSTHGLMIYHPDPVDYWRWTCAGLRKQVEDAGFTIDRFEGIMGLAATGLQMTQDAALPRVPRALRQLFTLCMQSTIALADRFQSAESRRLNSMVFALVASKR